VMHPILKLWKSGKDNDNEKEKVEKMIKEMTNYDINEDYHYDRENRYEENYNVEFANVLIQGMTEELYDFFDHAQKFTNDELYRTMLYHAAFLGDRDVVKMLIKKLRKHLSSSLVNAYQQSIRDGYRRGGHYHLINPPTSLEELIAGNLETVNDGKKEYVRAIIGIISFLPHDTVNKIFDSLNKQHWSCRMCGAFYRAACMKKNTYIVEKMEQLKLATTSLTSDHDNFHNKMIKCIMFDQFDELKKLFSSPEQDDRKDLEEHLLFNIFKYGRNNLPLLDFFIDNFGFNHKIGGVNGISLATYCEFGDRSILGGKLEWIRPRKINLTNKIYFFHLVKRGLLKIPIEIDRYLLKFVLVNNADIHNLHGDKKSSDQNEQILSDVEFLLRHGLHSIDSLRNLAPQFFTTENLTVLTLRLKNIQNGLQVSAKLLKEETTEIDERIKDLVFLLGQHLVIPELAKIILSYF
jgi:hypothetical protein